MINCKKGLTNIVLDFLVKVATCTGLNMMVEGGFPVRPVQWAGSGKASRNPPIFQEMRG